MDDNPWTFYHAMESGKQNKHNKNRKHVRNVAITLGDTLCTDGHGFFVGGV